MYSVVLATALTAGVQSPEFCWGACHGCSGCSGCYCSGCYCSGCSGCSGCWGWSNYSGNFCHGCSGCSGCYCSGCSCHGSYSSYAGYAGYAGYGQYSSYAGYAGYGQWGVYAPSHGSYGCQGCYGCYGGMSCYGAPLPHHGFYQEEVGPPSQKKKDGVQIEETPLPKEKTKDKEELQEVRARVIISVPADAKVYIDGQLMKSKSDRRVFQTPDLVAGQEYYYEVKAEVVRNGQTVTDTQTVLLRPGQVASASFVELGNETATATAGR